MEEAHALVNRIRADGRTPEIACPPAAPLRFWVFMLLAALALSLVLPQSISSVVPDEGAIGDVLTISGEGFGDGKQKVHLVPEDPKKAIALKVLTFSPSTITAEITKGLAGSYTLRVQPKGKGVAPILAPAPFPIVLPTDPSFLPTSASSADVVTLGASHLGKKKGTVKVGGVVAKVLSWVPVVAASSTDGAAPAGSLTFRVGKKTPLGPQPVVVKNKSGEVIFDGLTVVELPGGGPGPGAPPNPFDWAVPGLSFVMNGGPGPLFSPPHSGNAGIFPMDLQVFATANDFSTIHLYLDLPPGPFGKTALSGGKVQVTYQTLQATYATALNPLTGPFLSGAGATFSIDGTHAHPAPFFGTSFGGTFSATLVRISGTGPDTLTIASGFYWTSPG